MVVQKSIWCRSISMQFHIPNECPGKDTKQSDGEAPLMLEFWEMWNTPSLPSLPGPLRPGVVAPDKGPIYGLKRAKSWFEFTVFCI